MKYPVLSILSLLSLSHVHASKQLNEEFNRDASHSVQLPVSPHQNDLQNTLKNNQVMLEQNFPEDEILLLSPAVNVTTGNTSARLDNNSSIAENPVIEIPVTEAELRIKIIQINQDLSKLRTQKESLKQIKNTLKKQLKVDIKENWKLNKSVNSDILKSDFKEDVIYVNGTDINNMITRGFAEIKLRDEIKQHNKDLNALRAQIKTSKQDKNILKKKLKAHVHKNGKFVHVLDQKNDTTTKVKSEPLTTRQIDNYQPSESSSTQTFSYTSGNIPGRKTDINQQHNDSNHTIVESQQTVDTSTQQIDINVRNNAQDNIVIAGINEKDEAIIDDIKEPVNTHRDSKTSTIEDKNNKEGRSRKFTASFRKLFKHQDTIKLDQPLEEPK